MGDAHSAEQLVVGLIGFTVTQCVVAYAFALLLVRPLEAVPGQQHVRLTIETPFTCIVRGEQVACDPEHDPRGLGLPLTLLWRTVEAVHLATDGSLDLTFSGGARLVVPSHPTYESWQLHTPEQALLIAMPGGEIARFPPPRDAAGNS